MKDKEFLEWIYNRLIITHKENENYDYMHKLRNIIKKYDQNKTTLNIV